MKGLLEPAINGTTGILHAIKTHAPQVKRVVVTSSLAAMVNSASEPKLYDESSWNPITWDEASTQRGLAYRGSKTFAERSAWAFIKRDRPNFDLVTMNPPLVYGPVVHWLDNLDHLNTSNQRIRDLIQGKVRGPELPPTGTFLFTDVRDLALAQVKSIEIFEAGGKRFFITAGHYSNKEIVDVLRDTYPELASQLPPQPLTTFQMMSMGLTIPEPGKYWA
ncbi:hypothetical protein BKA64DRAFT_718928 [Cadophora sp. MPI-SDFR-AT-0126]|nr:hypothetical protein BKA64DRAFT_718928 [Leotiomycetes sp. MPI-SDFR-AT-0126]